MVCSSETVLATGHFLPCKRTYPPAILGLIPSPMPPTMIPIRFGVSIFTALYFSPNFPPVTSFTWTRRLFQLTRGAFSSGCSALLVNGEYPHIARPGQIPLIRISGSAMQPGVLASCLNGIRFASSPIASIAALKREYCHTA